MSPSSTFRIARHFPPKRSLNSSRLVTYSRTRKRSVGERLDTLSVSVLLPVYFKKAGVEEIRLLRRALDSVSVQTFPAQHEVILVDDGSPTPIKNLDFVNEAHRKIRMLRSEEIRGLLMRSIAASWQRGSR